MSANIGTTSQPPAFPRITDASFTSSEPLPANYTRELDPSGRPFYRNLDDNTTSWYHPAASRPSQDHRLPSHIERCVDVKGRSYYVNHETQCTSWLNPLKIEQARVRRQDTGNNERERTEDGELTYWVDYVADTVTVPRKSDIPWNEEQNMDGKLQS